MCASLHEAVADSFPPETQLVYWQHVCGECALPGSLRDRKHGGCKGAVGVQRQISLSHRWCFASVLLPACFLSALQYHVSVVHRRVHAGDLEQRQFVFLLVLSSIPAWHQTMLVIYSEQCFDATHQVQGTW